MRKITIFDSDWKFTKSDPQGSAEPGFDDSGWNVVNVPHDWAIKGPFDRNNDLQITMISENGETRPDEQPGRTGGLPHPGRGWYRKTFPVSPASSGKRFFIEFDGVMANSKVYLNGMLLGSWPYGYSSFCFDLTDHILMGAENVLAVSADVQQNASRWYPGGGIYRHVRLVEADSVHIAHWGSSITTPDVSQRTASVVIRTEILNHNARSTGVELETSILDSSGSEISVTTSTKTIKEAATIEQVFVISDPLLWDTASPNLYTAVSHVRVKGHVVDTYKTSFGIRDIRFDADEGFFLNDRPLKLQGVCMHHDLGPMGTAVNRRAIERQCEIMAAMGCNAIRTSHNPPAPELLEICDQMGIMVIDEAFDEWRTGKCENGYNKLFDEWAEKDLRALIRRDRNHPCVIMWSIGNEVPDQAFEDGAKIARFLVDICHDEDPTRPTTAGFNSADSAIDNGLVDVVDVLGWNYKTDKYALYHKTHSEWAMVGSETAATVSTRGEYHFPAEEVKIGIEGLMHESLQASSYDLSSPIWASAPDVEFAAQDDYPFMSGEFAWAGFDYLGEPNPYSREWPSRSSYFGVVDLCGIPKDRYYLYRSKWHSDVKTLHLLPHWNWAGREGDITPIYCYTNYDAAELFLNGLSQGIRRKNRNSVYDRYRLRWNDVRYEPGILKVVALDSNDHPIAETEMKTAGAPDRIRLRPDRLTILADGKDLSFITVEIVDQDGVLCPLADDTVRFEIEGPGRIVAVGNGDPTSKEPFISDQRKAFHGACILIVGSGRAIGQLRVRASADGIRKAELDLSLQYISERE